MHTELLLPDELAMGPSVGKVTLPKRHEVTLHLHLDGRLGGVRFHGVTQAPTVSQRNRRLGMDETFSDLVVWTAHAAPERETTGFWSTVQGQETTPLMVQLQRLYPYILLLCSSWVVFDI